MLVFFGTQYTVSQGTIGFFNPIKVDPILNIDLETKARGIDITLSVTGPLNKLTLTIPVQAGEDGKLFGSVTSADIAEELARNGHTVDKRSVVLDETLRELGVYHIRVKLFQDVEAKVRVFVTKQS